MLESDVVLMIGGTGSGNGTDFELYANDRLNNFSIGKLGHGRAYHMAAQLLNGRVVIAGGWNDCGAASNGCHIYDMKEKTWSVGPKLPHCLYFSSSAVVNEKMFVFGGCDGNNIYRTCYSLDVDLKTWESIASMNVARWGSSCAVLENQIYVCGGHDDLLCSVAIYDPILDLWKDGTPMTTAREGLAVVTFNECLYAIGGLNEAKQTLATCEKYDPAFGEWESITSLNIARFYFSAVVYNGAIHVFGGLDDEREALNSVEVYDPERNEWMHAPDMAIEREGFGCIVLNI